MMLLFWGLVIGLVVLAVRGFSGRSDAPQGNSALDVLKERYARGEIVEEGMSAARNGWNAETASGRRTPRGRLDLPVQESRTNRPIQITETSHDT